MIGTKFIHFNDELIEIFEVSIPVVEFLTDGEHAREKGTLIVLWFSCSFFKDERVDCTISQWKFK